VECLGFGFYFPDFLCCSNVNKGNRHENTKAFVIATIVLEKWHII